MELDEAKEILDLSPYEEYMIKCYGLDFSQILWYRWTLKNDCHGDINMMRQENPTSPEEAFISTGNPVFDNEKVQLRIEQLRLLYGKESPKKGRFYFEWEDPETQNKIVDSSIKWINDPHGIIALYEEPLKGVPYVIGGDTKGEGRDKYAGTVINNSTGKRCATLWQQSTNSKPYTWQMYCLGRYYNDALIGIEMNFNTAPIEELQRLKYPRQYVRRKYDDFKKQTEDKFGWKTDGNTRPLIIDKEIDLIENNIDLFTDIDFLNECLTFIYDKDGRPDAMSGKHDDILISDMIANEIRQQQTFKAEGEKPTFVKWHEDQYVDYWNCKTQEDRDRLIRLWGRPKNI